MEDDKSIDTEDFKQHRHGGHKGHGGFREESDLLNVIHCVWRSVVSVNHALDAFTQVDRIEVQQQAQVVMSEPEITQELRAMQW